MIGRSLLNNVKITRVLGAVAAGQAASASDILDMQGFEGVLFIAKVADVTNGSVLTLAAQQSVINDAGGMATLAGTVTYTANATDADDDLLVLDVYKPMERYVRAVLTSATQDAVKDGVIAIQYGARKVPITQGSTVLDSDTLISPDEA
jgi:hypothetical protein